MSERVKRSEKMRKDVKRCEILYFRIFHKQAPSKKIGAKSCKFVRITAKWCKRTPVRSHFQLAILIFDLRGGRQVGLFTPDEKRLGCIAWVVRCKNLQKPAK